MILQQGKDAPRALGFRILDYVWGVFPALSSLCLVVALWQYSHDQLGALLMPAPLSVLAQAGEILHSRAGETTILITLMRGAWGLLLALVLGISGGLLAGLSRSSALLMRPLVTLLLGTPPIIWVVLALFWFGLGGRAIVFTVAVTTAPMVFASAMMGLLSASTQLKEMLSVYRVGWGRKLRHFYLPHLTQQLLPAISVAVGTGLKITVMAELLGSNDGIGSALANSRAMLDTTAVMAYVVVIVSAIMLLEYGLLEPLKRLLLPARGRP